MMVAEEYKDIAPFDDEQFSQKMEKLVNDPGFENAIKYVLPGSDFRELAATLRKIDNKEDFQKKVMLSILRRLEEGTTDGVTDSGLENIDLAQPRLYMSNHRDIVLDASFLGLVMIRHGLPAQEVALGDNLLIYEWIENLVRLNKGIIVKRNLRMTKALEAARQLCGYIHYCISQKKESVWIAQREGRAKDSSDVTQESVLKMLSLNGESDNIAARLMELHLTPVAISYEFDPNDYLKATEFLARRRDPQFKKSQKDDLRSMETGLLKHKGRVHFSICKEINPALEPLLDSTDKVEIIRHACAIIDKEIHSGYKIYPVNYYAYDKLEGTSEFAGEYTAEQAHSYEEYFNGQLDKVRLEDVTKEEREFMLEAMLKMYANPLRNQLKSTGN
ncbi:MAG: 1-acyl-sn-glycerol-3-phosphate acyltransferase [Muribaculaceae bacterium]